MGFLSALQGQRIYLDTNIWIYALEGYPSFIQFLTELFSSIDQGNLNAVTSELTLAEVLGSVSDVLFEVTQAKRILDG